MVANKKFLSQTLLYSNTDQFLDTCLIIENDLALPLKAFPLIHRKLNINVLNVEPNLMRITLVETCGPPQIQNTMLNQTKNPGDSVYFRCQATKIIFYDHVLPLSFKIDMSKCMVSFIDWYHDTMDGSERTKVKVRFVTVLFL